ncbi:hypothetical protein ACIQCR_12550 [Streptomyces sp. NPDC093249]|uniref:hypothetical protein n=1 Tax=unclassified Streptomyces TaxID=2593676 RepID=UPI003815A15C
MVPGSVLATGVAEPLTRHGGARRGGGRAEGERCGGLFDPDTLFDFDFDPDPDPDFDLDSAERPEAAIGDASYSGMSFGLRETRGFRFVPHLRDQADQRFCHEDAPVLDGEEPGGAHGPPDAIAHHGANSGRTKARRPDIVRGVGERYDNALHRTAADRPRCRADRDARMAAGRVRIASGRGRGPVGLLR